MNNVLKNVKGTNDSLPNEQIVKNAIINEMRQTFESLVIYHLRLLFYLLMIYYLLNMQVEQKY